MSPSLNNDFDALTSSPSFEVTDASIFKKKVLSFSKDYKRVCILDNNFPTQHSEQEYIAAFGGSAELNLKAEKGGFDSLKAFCDNTSDKWKFGSLSYDLKNDNEDLVSANEDNVQFPSLHFFVPELILYLNKGKIYIKSDDKNALEIFNRISDEKVDFLDKTSWVSVNNDLRACPDHLDYVGTIQRLKEEIKLGNIYEINYCRELSGKCAIDPYRSFAAMNELSKAPFSCFYKLSDNFLLCSSPERFLKKSGNEIISQPIKGTKRRSDDKHEDELLKKQLLEDVKERAENVMIVDLVRNDLSHTAERGSVEVVELFGIHSFPHVHQMISTVKSKLKQNVHFVDAIRYCFPMGSMTGAPKLRATELIEKHEQFKRGLFSGSVGFITPGGNFDFNVVIRSILYNRNSDFVSIRTGSAITDMCEPENEWSECELKAKVLLSCLKR